MCMEMGDDSPDADFEDEGAEEPFMPDEPQDEGSEHPFSEMKAAECE